MGEFHRHQSKVWWGSFHEEGSPHDIWPRKNLSVGENPTNTEQNTKTVWESPELTTNRGESSSPSQGSHGSQDSGFSDSELHQAQESPELSKRKDSPEQRLLPVVNHPPTPATGRNSGKKFKYHLVEFDEELIKNEKEYLETSFNGSHTFSDEKVNQIQNQLEVAVKSPKKGSPEKKPLLETAKRTAPELDRDGFKIPRCVNLKGSCASLASFVDNPPVSCSTPKAAKKEETEFHTQEKVTCRSTLATVRKLKGISERRGRYSAHLQRTLERGGVISELDTNRLPVAKWLIELEHQYEAEIMTTLQSKSLASDLTRQVTHLAAATSDTIRQLHQTAKVIAQEFSKLSIYVKGNNKIKQLQPLVQSLVGHVKQFMVEFVENDKLRAKTEEMVTSFREDVDSTKCPVVAACERLQDLVGETEVDSEAVEKQRLRLAEEFRAVVDQILLSHIRALVAVLEDPRTELSLRTALSALCALGLEGSHLGQLMSQCGGVRALLAICLEGRATVVRISALRALATICCFTETIRQFENAGGVEVIADIMADKRRSEGELTEAAAVLAQITAPWVEDNHSVLGLAEHLSSFVASLTFIIERFKSSESLLLSSAALANLTFMEPRTVWALLQNKTAGILLSAVRKQGPKVSVFIQEQAATILANMAAVPECREHLAEHRAVVALLCFLQIQHSPLQRPPEQLAAERIQQKSAIALSRLCSDATVARQVVELQGANRLVRLCKDERERNYSDGVLVACLAALRKIVANCGTDPLKELSAVELVEPKLLDSFLMYSSRQESYV